MANVQFGGLITGLDVNALISGLAKAEHRSVDVLQTQKVRFQAQDGVLTTLIGALGSLKSAAQGLSLSGDFEQRSAASSDTTVLTASADSTAEAGSNTIVVDRLATARIVKSTSFTSSSDSIGTGALTITVDGTSTEITIDATNNTLTGLKSAINSSGAAVAASVINAGTSDSPDYRLVVQSEDTGTANAVAISGTLTGGTDPFPGGGTEVQAAADALFSVNGLSITRSSNAVSDVVTGVTFVLLEEGDKDGVVESTDSTSKVTVSVDSTAIKTSVKDLVDSFNAVNKIVKDQFTLNPDTKRQGALGGDASLRGVIARLRKELSAASESDGDYRYISDIGIAFQEDGSLTLDEAELSSALEDDPDGVAELFTLVNNGIGKRVPDTIDDYISSVDGTLTFRQNGIRTRIENIDKKVAREEARIAALQERLTKQFSALEQMVSQLKAQGDFLSQQMTALSRR